MENTTLAKAQDSTFGELIQKLQLFPSDTDDILDQIELEIYRLSLTIAAEAPVTHTFTKDMYSREIFMPKGAILTSKIHKTQHQYVVLSGMVAVFTEKEGVVKLRAPYVGVTEPGTRRLLYALEDTRWITFHPTRLIKVKDIERQIIQPRENKYIEHAKREIEEATQKVLQEVA